jgi:hypothetical protein
MGHAEPQADGIAQMFQRNLTYDDISHSMHCSKREIRQIDKAMREANYQEGPHIELPQISQGPNRDANFALTA